jgi:hypothetical protein
MVQTHEGDSRVLMKKKIENRQINMLLWWGAKKYFVEGHDFVIVACK